MIIKQTQSSATGLDEKALEAAFDAFEDAANEWHYEPAGTEHVINYVPERVEDFIESVEAQVFHRFPQKAQAMAFKRGKCINAAIRAYMSALTVTSFPAAEQHDVTSHAVPHDGEGAVAWRCAKCGCHSFARVDVLSDGGKKAFEPGPNVRCVNCKDVSFFPFTHPAPVAAQPAEGWVLVPREPTPEMIHAGWKAIMDYPDEKMMSMGVVDLRANVCYRAMLASSPTPPVPAGVREALTHAFNEMSDGLANDIQRVRNLRDGHYKLDDIDRAALPDMEAWLETCNNLARKALAALSALPAQPNSSERQKALDAAADLIDGWTTATNSRHLQGWGVHTNAVADMLAKRDAEIATAIRALATNPEPKP